MEPNEIARTVGAVLGSFIFITVISRVIWFVLAKVMKTGDRVAMWIAFAGSVSALLLRATSTSNPPDILRTVSQAIAAIMYLLLDWRIAVLRDRENKPTV